MTVRKILTRDRLALRATERHAQHRQLLHAQERRRDERVRPEPFQAEGRRDRRDRDVRINDQLHPPRRPSATAATQLGTGSPSSNRFHYSGRSSVGYQSQLRAM